MPPRLSHRARRGPTLAASAGLALLALAACDAAPLAWEPATVDGASSASSPPQEMPPPPTTMPTDARGTRCDSSVRVAPVGSDDGVVAVWWAVRGDSTALLLSSRGALAPRAVTPGASAGPTEPAAWERAVVIDSVDRGAHGCARPAPAVAFEPRTGYLHVSYPLDAPEGTGVFFAHSMDAGRMYHSPVSIVYGPRLAATAIDAHGDTVAITYEDPNTGEPQVALALSFTAGHIFEEKSIPVSAGAFAALEPRVQAGPAGVLVTWRERRPERDVPMRRYGRWAR